MSRFTENVNAYLSAKKIKNSFLSLKTGFDASKLSRILNDRQAITESEMSIISNALGHDYVYFLQEHFAVPPENNYMGQVALCYAGNPSKQQAITVDALIQFAENIDNVLSAKAAFYEAIGDSYHGIE